MNAQKPGGMKAAYQTAYQKASEELRSRSPVQLAALSERCAAVLNGSTIRLSFFGSRVELTFVAKDRIEFAVLGDTVNVAFGLEALARPNRILIGARTFQAVQAQQSALGIGPVTIKGRTQPVEVFEVLRP